MKSAIVRTALRRRRNHTAALFGRAQAASLSTSATSSSTPEESGEGVAASEAAASAPAAAPAPSPSSVASLFDTLEYGPAPEARDVADRWLDSHGRVFGQFIDNKFVGGGASASSSMTSAPSLCPAGGEVLAENVQATEADVDAAHAAAAAAQPKWAALSGHARSRHLYAIARHLQKHQRLLAVLESLDNGKNIRETRDVDTALAIRHFYSHAGWAQLMDSDPELKGMAPVGVCAAIIPWNFPLLMAAWKLAPALACGNTVVLKPAPSTRLTAWALAQICAEAGLPPGVVNVVSGDDTVASYLAQHDGFDKLAFTGSTGVGRLLREQTAGTGKSLSLELGGKNPMVVFDSCDLDAAVEGLVNGTWFNSGQVCCAASRVLVQESVAEEFEKRARRRLSSLRVGHPLDKCSDMSSLVHTAQWDRVHSYVKAGVEEGANVYQGGEGGSLDDEEGMRDARDNCFYPPTLVTGVESTSLLVREEIFGPVATVQTFRTPKVREYLSFFLSLSLSLSLCFLFSKKL